MEGRLCKTPGCCNTAKLQCPACIKLNIQGSFFCSQGCFRDTSDLHKAFHKIYSEDYFLERAAMCTDEKDRGLDLERAALWKWNPVIAADIMGYGNADQHSSSSSSSQVSKSHTNTAESMKNNPVDRNEMHEDSSMVEVNVELADDQHSSSIQMSSSRVSALHMVNQPQG